MKKISFIIPTLSNGGAERVVSNLAKAISDRQENYIIIYHDTEKSYDYRGNLINLHIDPSPSKIGKILNLLRRTLKLKKIKKEYQFDKSISFLDNPNLINIFSKNSEDVFVSIRNQQSKEFIGVKKKLHKFAMKFIYTKAKKIIAISEGVKKDLVENFGLDPQKIVVIYNPVDLPRINELKREQLETKHKNIFSNPTIITIGRLSYQKGHWHLIRAFQKVVEKIPNAKLIILGTGKLRDDLEVLVKDLKLSNSVFLLGFQENPFKYIYHSDIFVLPSLYEGLGNVILEAMACETPVISTDCKSGPRELIAPATDLNSNINDYSIEKYGILTPVPNELMYGSNIKITKEETVLSNSILMLLENPQLSQMLKEKGKERVKEFNFDIIADKWLNLLR